MATTMETFRLRMTLWRLRGQSTPSHSLRVMVTTYRCTLLRRQQAEEEVLSVEPDYNACNDRILRLTKDENGKATLMFDINMQNIIDEKYAEVVQTLQNAKIVKEKNILHILV